MLRGCHKFLDLEIKNVHFDFHFHSRLNSYIAWKDFFLLVSQLIPLKNTHTKTFIIPFCFLFILFYVYLCFYPLWIQVIKRLFDVLNY